MDRLLRLPAVREAVGLSPSQIFRLERAGSFPRRVRLTANTVAWLESEVSEWINARTRGVADAPSRALAARGIPAEASA